VSLQISAGAVLRQQLADLPHVKPEHCEDVSDAARQAPRYATSTEFLLFKSNDASGLWVVEQRTRETSRQDASIMVKAAALDVREFTRFVVSGLAATIGNIGTVWLARRFLSFEIALIAGIATAIAISFSLSKFFAFRSPAWSRAAGEAVRFLIVYATGCAIYWTAAVVLRNLLLAHGMAVEVAELGSILVGAGSMMLTSYFGHRFFTYRTYQRTKRLDSTL
jgi:putative flippase GtrA